MNDEQFAILAATVEVLGGTLRYLLARDIKALPDAEREQFLKILQGSLSRPSMTAAPMEDKDAAAYADLAVWQPVAAERLIDGVRQQLRIARG